MFIDELAAIRQAEEQAEHIKKSIKIETKRMIEAANAEAEQILSEQESAGKELYDALIAEGVSEADSEYEAALEKAHMEAEEMAAAAEAKKDAAVEFILERIVGPVGNN